MKKTGCIWSIVLGVFLVAMGATYAPAAEVITKTETITWYDVELEAIRTADNFIVLFNSAKTMGKPYKNTGMTQLQAAKQIMQERNKLLPALSFNAGLYTFSPDLKAYYPMKPYNKEAFATAIAQLPSKAHGRTEIQRALVSLEPVLKGLSGKTVIFVFTDGVNTAVQPAEVLTPNEFRRTPRELAWELSQKYNVCFNVISTASGELEKELLESVAAINECSRVLPMEAMLGKPEYMAGSLFVMDEKVFEVTKTQEKVVGFKMNNILFDFNKAVIKPEFTNELNKLGNFLQEHPQAYVVLAGFTDPIGSSEYNLHLSRRRVEGVRKYLQAKFQLPQDQIVTLWYGDLAPVASNDDEEGRSKNRRVAGIVAGL